MNLDKKTAKAISKALEAALQRKITDVEFVTFILELNDYGYEVVKKQK